MPIDIALDGVGSREKFMVGRVKVSHFIADLLSVQSNRFGLEGQCWERSIDTEN